MSYENLCITPNRKKCNINRSKVNLKNSGRKLSTCFNSKSCKALIIGCFHRHKTLSSTRNTSSRRYCSQNYSSISSFRLDLDDHSFRKQIAKDYENNHYKNHVLHNDPSIIRYDHRCHRCIYGVLNNSLTSILNTNTLCWKSESESSTNVLNKSVTEDNYVAATFHRMISPSQNYKCVMPLEYSVIEGERNSKSKMSLDNGNLEECPNLPCDICSSETVSLQQTISQKENITKRQYDTNVKRSCIIEKHSFIYHSSRDNMKPKTNLANTNEKCSGKIGSLGLGLSSSKKTLPDFFPVRRSIRKTRTVVQEEMNKSLERAIIEGREEYLQIKIFPGKGRGVITLRSFEKGEFVVEYVGELISIAEANQREKQYVLDGDAGCYMFYFKFRDQQYCIDATAESDKMGRLINHSRNGNLITKVIDVQNQPRLVLLAKDNIQPGEELSYDYGDRSKESLLHHPWLAL